jgi:hypothetical protein
VPPDRCGDWHRLAAAAECKPLLSLLLALPIVADAYGTQLFSTLMGISVFASAFLLLGTWGCAPQKRHTGGVQVRLGWMPLAVASIGLLLATVGMTLSPTALGTA